MATIFVVALLSYYIETTFSLLEIFPNFNLLKVGGENKEL